MAKVIRLFTLAAVATAAMLFSAAPASAATGPCSAPYTAAVLDPLADAELLILDLNGDGTICAYVNGDVALIGDNSLLTAVLDALPTGWTVVSTDGDVTIGDNVTISVTDLIDVDQRGNRNNGVGVVPICSQNTGNSCFSNNKFNVKVIVSDLV